MEDNLRDKPLVVDDVIGKEVNLQRMGRIPKKNGILTVNGLEFTITFSDEVKGIFHAKLKKRRIK